MQVRITRICDVFLIFILLYLSIQLAVNATIIDTISIHVNPPTLERTKQAAELLAAVGPAFIIIQSFIIRDMNVKITSIGFMNILKCCIIVIACFVMITPAQRWIASWIVKISSAEQRRSAIVVTAGTLGVIAGNYDVPDIGLTREFARDPATKAAILLFSPITLLSNIADGMRDDAGPVIAGALFQNRKAFAPIFEEKTKSFCSYFENLYMEYRQKSEKIDRTWYYKMFGSKIFHEKRDEFFGYDAELTLGLPRSHFVRHPDIQAKIRYKIFSTITEFPLSPQLAHVITKQEMISILNGLFARKILDPCLSWDELERDYIGPLLWKLREYVQAITQDDRYKILAEGERFERIGRQAIYAVVAPSLALAWTLLGSIAGFAALLKLILKNYLNRGFMLSSMIAVSLFAVLAWAPFTQPNHIADSKGFQHLKAHAEKRSPVLGADMAFVEWVLRTAPIVYPIGAFLRDFGPGILLGLNRRE